MSLATVHELLYSDARVDMVRADLLLSEIVRSTVNVGASRESAVETRMTLAPVELAPDQAVPLTLLTTEAVTNALKNLGPGPDRFLSVQLEGTVTTDQRDGRYTLQVRFPKPGTQLDTSRAA